MDGQSCYTSKVSFSFVRRIYQSTDPCFLFTRRCSSTEIVFREKESFGTFKNSDPVDPFRYWVGRKSRGRREKEFADADHTSRCTPKRFAFGLRFDFASSLFSSDLNKNLQGECNNSKRNQFCFFDTGVVSLHISVEPFFKRKG